MDCLPKVRVRELLGIGKAKARTGKELASVLGLRDDRFVRHAIRELIADKVPVASSVAPPYGYFIANSLEEATVYEKNLKSRLVEDAYRLRDFKFAVRATLQPCQLPLL